ncbi:hypothetical protein CUT44_23450 [Streptomyces carminius]|uniref:Secreted protein n=1 Tax=Streptomyces carminius TaxID=2665496 RepID=A0A2M8LTJ5_9ACTN|nr:hypothetical protein CUT44_23450 [Streptomyces carminius]
MLVALACALVLLPASAAAAEPAAAGDRGIVQLSKTPAAKVGAGEKAPARANASWVCNRQVTYPGPYYVDFTCTVYSGAIRAYVVCSDGAVFYSGTMYAGATYQMRGTCGPPWTVSTSGEQSLW